MENIFMKICIGPESDHWLCLSLTHSLTESLLFSGLVDLMAVNDTKCMMMSQQLLKTVKSFLKLKKKVVYAVQSLKGC